jgi:hypothetical protein
MGNYILPIEMIELAGNVTDCGVYQGRQPHVLRRYAATTASVPSKVISTARNTSLMTGPFGFA